VLFSQHKEKRYREIENRTPPGLPFLGQMLSYSRPDASAPYTILFQHNTVADGQLEVPISVQ
jgi:hypothetical protein